MPSAFCRWSRRICLAINGYPRAVVDAIIVQERRAAFRVVGPDDPCRLTGAAGVPGRIDTITVRQL
jgi:hypothetical protein